MSTREQGSRVFKVRLDVGLPDEVLERIERAIQRAVLTELAGTDIADGYSVVMRAPTDDAAVGAPADTSAFERPGTGRPDLFGGSGATDGIWIREGRDAL